MLKLLMAFQIGQVVCGRFEIMGIMPSPSFGELYRAHHRDLGVETALLVLGPSLLPDEATRAALVARVNLARGLRQPNLVWLYDVRAEGNEVVIAAQWAGIDTLRARMEKRKAEQVGWPLSADEAWSILQQIAYAVVQLHRDAEVLGDLRADTILVTPDGLKLFNHGVGCALPRERFLEALERSGEDMIIAPEVRGGQPPTVRSDVYSLAALMHELTFGEPPLAVDPYIVPRASTRPQLAEVLKRALQPEPFERPLSVDALLREIQPTLAEAEQPMAASAFGRDPSLRSGPDESPPHPSSLQNTVIGEVKLPPAIQAAVDRAKAAAAAAEAGTGPSAAEWGGKNEAVTRELEVDEVESLLGKNQTRQIELDEIEALLLKSKDPALEQALATGPKKDVPKPQLFSAPQNVEFDAEKTLGAPVIELRAEDKKTREMGALGVPLAGSAPPPLWEDVKSKIERASGTSKKRSVLPFVLIALVVAGLAGGGAWLYTTGQWRQLMPASSPDLAPAAVAPAVTAAPLASPAAAAAVPAVVPAGPCPAGTVLVDKRVCVDVYEYPGEGQVPRVNVSFVEAAQLCGARGARLCSDAEWEHACTGPGGSAYPYGAKFESGKCNAKGAGGKLLPSGSVATCKSAAGAYDMSGNVAEWVVVDPQKLPAIKGGSALAGDPDASCTRKLDAKSLAGGPLVGFRCCRDVH